MGRPRQGLFRTRGARLRIQRPADLAGRQIARSRRQGRRLSDLRARTQLQHQLRLPLDDQRRGLGRARQALSARLFGRPGGGVRAARIRDHPPRAAGRRADLGRLPVGQPLRDDPGAGTISAARRDRAVLRRRAAVPAHGEADRPRGAGRLGVQRAVLLPGAARLPQDHRTRPS